MSVFSFITDLFKPALAMSFLGLYGFGRSVEKTADTVKLGK